MRNRKRKETEFHRRWLQILMGISCAATIAISGRANQAVLAQEKIEEPVNVQLMTADVETEVKESPKQTAKTLMTYQADDNVMVIGEENDWYQIRYQDITGYVPKANLAPMEMDVETLDEEFAKEAEEGKLVVETVEYYREQRKRTIIWGTVIAVLVIAIFATGIISAVRRGKKELPEES